MPRIPVACLAAALCLPASVLAETKRDIRPAPLNQRYDASLSRYDRVFAHAEDARELGVFVGANGKAQLFMKNEIIFQPKNRDDLANFLAATRGRLPDEPLPPNLERLRNEKDRAAFERRHRLVRFDAASFDLAAIGTLGERAGLTGAVRFRDEASARTVAAALALAAKGFRVELNAVAMPQQALLTRTSEAGGADAFAAPGMQTANVSRAWQLMVAAGITNKTRIAVIDSATLVPPGRYTFRISGLGPQRDYHLRIRRDDAGRDVAMQPFAILSVRPETGLPQR